MESKIKYTRTRVEQVTIVTSIEEFQKKVLELNRFMLIITLNLIRNTVTIMKYNNIL